MRSPLERIRGRLEDFRASEAALLRARLDGADEAGARRDARADRLALGTGENREDLEAARSLGLLSPRGEARILRHVADAAFAEAFERTAAPEWPRLDTSVPHAGRLVALATLADDLLTGPRDEAAARGASIAAALDRDREARREALDAGDEAAARVLARSAPDDDDPPAELEAHLRAFLDATDEPLVELRARALHARATRDPSWVGLARALAAEGAAGAWHPRHAAHGVSALLEPLGLRDPLARAVRLGAHARVGPTVVVVPGAGTTIEVRAGAPGAGVVGRLLVVEGAVGALARALVPRGAVLEERAPWSGSTLWRTLGATMAGALAEPRILAQSCRLDAGDARRELPVARYALLAVARLRAVRALSAVARPAVLEARMWAARALGQEEPAPSAELAHPSTAARGELESIARAALAGFAAPVALRERFDADWARNPRVEQVVRAAAQHGVTLAAERWLAELGGRPEDAAARARELAGA